MFHFLALCERDAVKRSHFEKHTILSPHKKANIFWKEKNLEIASFMREKSVDEVLNEFGGSFSL